MNMERGFLRFTIVLSVLTGIALSMATFNHSRTIYTAKDFETGKTVKFAWDSPIPPNYADCELKFVLAGVRKAGGLSDADKQSAKERKWQAVTQDPFFPKDPVERTKLRNRLFGATTIPELLRFRQKYPEYDDLSDLGLATKLAAKYPECADLPAKVKSAKPEKGRIVSTEEFMGSDIHPTPDYSDIKKMYEPDTLPPPMPDFISDADMAKLLLPTNVKKQPVLLRGTNFTSFAIGFFSIWVLYVLLRFIVIGFIIRGGFKGNTGKGD